MNVSVIIPVLHEADLICSTLARLRAIGGGRSPEILVVDGSPQGDTLSSIKDAGVTRILSERGRANQMNKGAAAAGGDILLFLHADTDLPDDALDRITEAMEGTAFAGGAFDLEIAAEGFPFRLIEKAASLRSRLTRIPYGDQAIFIRRECFLGMGGYRELPLLEDVDLMRRLKRRGGKIRIIPKRVKTSGRRWVSEGVLKCTLRNWTIMTLHLLGVSPHKLARWYLPQSSRSSVRNLPPSP